MNTDPDDAFLNARSSAAVARLLPFARAICQGYFRLRVDGVENIPEGAALFVGNHNNGIAGPEVLGTLTTLWELRGPDAPLYGLAHDFAMLQLKPVGWLLERYGGIRATPENARRALAAGAQLLVYPGGDLDSFRHFRKRDEIILGPRSGFVRTAQQTGVPLVPVVAQGAHRSALVVSEGEDFARRIGLKRWARLERFPLALCLPWGITAGPWLPWLPLPFPVRLRFLPPRRVAPGDDPAEAKESVRSEMQAALDDMARAGRSRPT